MDEKKTTELLLTLVQDISYIKGRLDTLDEIKMEQKENSNKIEKIEAQNERHERQIVSLEKRATTMEEWNRNKMNDSKKQMSSVFISMGIAIFSAIVSIVVGLMF
jgi:uncharacterized membrane protein